MKNLEIYEDFLFEKKNRNVIEDYVQGTYNKEKPGAGSNHLYIQKVSNNPNLCTLRNYNTDLLYQNLEGDFFYNQTKYSATTSKIQTYIKIELGDVDYIKTDEDGIKKAIDADIESEGKK